jgi:hypothetical protein
MANLTFGTVDLSALGLAVHGHNSREMAQWDTDRVQLPYRYSVPDLTGKFGASQTQIQGVLSADADVWANHTHVNFLARLDLIKAALAPILGYQKLVLADQSTRYRWARYANMGFAEQRPWQKLPFQPITLQFDNLEPFWRLPLSTVSVTTLPAFLQNTSPFTIRPKISLDINGAISGTSTDPAALLTIGGLTASWGGSGADALAAGDHVDIDSEALTVTLTRAGGGVPQDYTRCYEYRGPSAFATDGFPTISPITGAFITALHTSISTTSVAYEPLTP